MKVRRVRHFELCMLLSSGVAASAAVASSKVWHCSTAPACIKTPCTVSEQPSILLTMESRPVMGDFSEDHMSDGSAYFAAIEAESTDCEKWLLQHPRHPNQLHSMQPFCSWDPAPECP